MIMELEIKKLIEKVEALENNNNYTKQLENENLALVQQVTSIKIEVDKELQRMRAENAKLTNDFKTIKARMDEIDGVNETVTTLKNIAVQHKRKINEKHMRKKHTTDEEKDLIDEAWEMLKDEVKEED